MRVSVMDEPYPQGASLLGARRSRPSPSAPRTACSCVRENPPPPRTRCAPNWKRSASRPRADDDMPARSISRTPDLNPVPAIAHCPAIGGRFIAEFADRGTASIPPLTPTTTAPLYASRCTPCLVGAKNGITVSQILPNPVLPPSFLRRSAMGKVETSCLRWAAPNPREKTRTQCRPPFFACPLPTNADSYVRIWRSNATKSTDDLPRPAFRARSATPSGTQPRS
jgi:hypothetical protein